VYTFMQVSGMTNHHLILCYRFAECVAAATGAKVTDQSEANSGSSNQAMEQKMNGTNGLAH
jgi:DNA-3-methyladenine glycosylase I